MGKKRKADDGAAALPDTMRMQGIEGDAPFAVYFPSGFQPDKANADFEAYVHGSRPNQYAVVSRTDHNVDFVGSTTSAEYTTAASCRYALAVFDRSTGELEIAPVKGGRVLRMEPRARGIDYSVLQSGSTNEADAGLKDRRERNARLVEEFGSQRRRRQLAVAKSAQVEANQISEGSAVLGMIAAAGTGAGTREEILAATLSGRNIPPHRPEATTAEEAYPWSDIVPASVRDALEVRKLFPAVDKPEYRAELQKSKTFGGGYVLSRVGVLDEAGTPAEREGRARCLALLGHLLKLYKGSAFIKVRAEEGIGPVADKLKMASSVLEGILELFYAREVEEEGDSYILSKEKKSLMLTWLLVLALRAEPQSVLDGTAFAALTDELKLRAADVRLHFRELGCTIMSVNGEGERGRGSSKVTLLPSGRHDKEKTLADSFPDTKMGGKKPGGK